jgi:Ni/Co efflux regulator RcnB
MGPNRGMRLVSSMLLMGALAAPVGLQAQERNDHDQDDQARAQQHDRDHDRRDKDHDRKDNDRRWNRNEEPYYRQWYTQTHNGQEYREYSRMNKRDRDDYWKWRENHRDADHDRDDQRGKEKDHDRDNRRDKDHDRDHDHR